MSREVPEGWADITLGELADIVGGSTPSKAESAYWEGGNIPWATPSDVTRLPAGVFELEKTDAHVTKDAVEKTSLRLLPAGSVLMTSRATVGYPVINTVPMATNQGFANFLPNPRFDARFLAQWCVHNRPTLERMAGGSTFLEISKRSIRAIGISLPPLPEQRRIAEILSSVDEAIQTTQAVIDQTRKVKQGVLARLMTKGIGHTRFKQTEIGEIPESWSYGKFKDFVFLQRGFDLPVQSRSSGEIPIYASNGVVGTHNQSRISGPTVTTGRSGTLGKVFYYKGGSWPLNTTLYVKDFCNNDPYFVYWFLRYFRLERFGTGTGVPTLNRNIVHEERVCFPNIHEQRKIAQILFGFSTTLDMLREKQVALLNVKVGLMSELLTGRVRVPADLPMAAE